MTEKINRIQNFDGIPDEYGIPRDILKAIENREKSKNSNQEIHFTEMQQSVFADPDFWYTESKDRQPKNLVIQGATSAGKTLTAELLVLQCISKLKKHAIYLVPLKALVMDKVKSFNAVNDRKITPESEFQRIRIYASSADYQDHDFEISQGDYDIAVMVYEKFFALLGQSNRMLKDVGLIVVDEMQMLEFKNRGGKLEYGITKVKQEHKDIRFVGLLTSDYIAEPLATWLEGIIICNKVRPVGIHERLINLEGSRWSRFLPDNGIAEDAEPKKDQIGLFDEAELRSRLGTTLYGKDKEGPRTRLLLSVLKYCLTKKPDAQFIIFVPNKRGCQRTARAIVKSGICKEDNCVKLSDTLLEAVSRMDVSSDNEILSEILPLGVAYHTASLPAYLRDEIETAFRQKLLRILVATETITIGMNLPADVMIITDVFVPRNINGLSTDNKGTKVELKPSEYKNYIGRAGRLGMAEEGESYLLVNEKGDSKLSSRWREFVLAGETTIESEFSFLEKRSGENDSEAYARECAPYYLNLLLGSKGSDFTEKDIESLQKETLSAEPKDFKSTDVINQLTNNKLATKKDVLWLENDDEYDELEQHDKNENFRSENDDETKQHYELSAIGKALAPYALRLKTCRSIYRRFYQDVSDTNGPRSIGGLPMDYNAADMGNGKYLLDILYCVCSMEEARNVRLVDTQKDEGRLNMTLGVIKRLEEYQKSYGGQAFWENSFLGGLLKAYGSDRKDDRGALEWDQLCPIVCAFVLFDWIEGKYLKEIRKSFGDGARDKITEYSADVDRLAETVSYLLEAIGNCIRWNINRGVKLQNRCLSECKQENGNASSPEDHLKDLKAGFNSLARQVKHGLKNSQLLYMAGRHVYGIDRNVLLKIGKVAEKMGYESPRAYVVYSDVSKLSKDLKLNEACIDELKKQLSEWDGGDGDHLDKLIDMAEAENLLPKDVGLLADIRDAKDKETFFSKLKELVGEATGKYWRTQTDEFGREIAFECDSIIDGHTVIFFPLFKRKQDTVDNIAWRNSHTDVIAVVRYSGSEINFPEHWHVLTVEMFLRIFITTMKVLQTGGDTNYLHLQYILNQLGWIEFKGQKKLFHDISKMANAVYQQPPMEQFLATISSKLGDELGSGTFGTVYEIVDKTGNTWALKEVKTPNSTTKTELDKRIECMRKYAEKNHIDTDNRDSVLKTLLQCQGYCDGEQSDQLKEEYNSVFEEALSHSKEDAAQAKEENRYQWFFRSLVYTLEGLCYRVKGEKMKEWASECSNIVPVKDVSIVYQNAGGGKSGNSVFLRMKLMDGSLEKFKKECENSLTTPTLCNIGTQIGNALEVCHQHGIIHRDVKPGNILYKALGNAFEYYLADFDTAQIIRTDMTQRVGSLPFMAPEVKNGNSYDERCDQYSLAKTLIDLVEEKKDILSQKPIWDILEKASAENSKDRYPTIEEFLHDLNNKA